MAALSSVAATVSAGASAASTYQSWQSAQDQAADVQKIKKLRSQQAADLLGQIESEDVIYQDELDMIKKQTELAGTKLLAGTEGAIEQTGVKLSQAVGETYGGRFDTGSGERGRLETKAGYEDMLADVKESYDLSMDEIALREESSEREAFLRHEEVLGSLEAQREEILAML